MCTLGVLAVGRPQPRPEGQVEMYVRRVRTTTESEIKRKIETDRGVGRCRSRKKMEEVVRGGQKWSEVVRSGQKRSEIEILDYVFQREYCTWSAVLTFSLK